MTSDYRAVDEWQNVDAGVFREKIQPAGKPAVIRGALAGWPLVRTAAQGDDAFLAELAAYGGAQKVEAFEAPSEIEGRLFYNDDLTGFNFERRTLAFSALLDALGAGRSEAQPPCLYAGAVRIRDGFQPLADAHPAPFLPSETERLVSLWIGNRTRTAPHWDLPQNLACVLAGRRRFLLFPTEQVPNLYIGPLDLTLAGQPVSLVDPNRPDLERFPDYALVRDAAQEVILEPGDVLYLPSMWVHYVESLDPVGAMLNFWWRDGPEHLVTPFLTLLHGLLTLRDLPEQERQAWRVIFDHYLFQQNGDPMAHLPDTARGLFGEMTPDRLQRIRAHLTRTLNR